MSNAMGHWTFWGLLMTGSICFLSDKTSLGLNAFAVLFILYLEEIVGRLKRLEKLDRD